MDSCICLSSFWHNDAARELCHFKLEDLYIQKLGAGYASWAASIREQSFAQQNTSTDVDRINQSNKIVSYSLVTAFQCNATPVQWGQACTVPACLKLHGGSVNSVSKHGKIWQGLPHSHRIHLTYGQAMSSTCCTGIVRGTVGRTGLSAACVARTCASWVSCWTLLCWRSAFTNSRFCRFLICKAPGGHKWQCLQSSPLWQPPGRQNQAQGLQPPWAWSFDPIDHLCCSASDPLCRSSDMAKPFTCMERMGPTQSKDQGWWELLSHNTSNISFIRWAFNGLFWWSFYHTDTHACPASECVVESSKFALLHVLKLLKWRMATHGLPGDKLEQPIRRIKTRIHWIRPIQQKNWLCSNNQ